MGRKLKSRAGETLAEVLVSILVIAFALLLLASMVSASGSIDLSTRERDGEFYENLTSAEKKENVTGTGTTGTVTVDWKDGEGGNVGSTSFTVNVFGDRGLASYAKED